MWFRIGDFALQEYFTLQGSPEETMLDFGVLMDADDPVARQVRFVNPIPVPIIIEICIILYWDGTLAFFLTLPKFDETDYIKLSELYGTEFHKTDVAAACNKYFPNEHQVEKGRIFIEPSASAEHEDKLKRLAAMLSSFHSNEFPGPLLDDIKNLVQLGRGGKSFSWHVGGKKTNSWHVGEYPPQCAHVNPSLKDSTAVVESIKCGESLQKVHKHLQEGKDPNRCYILSSPLELAIWENNAKLIALLLFYYANPYSREGSLLTNALTAALIEARRPSGSTLPWEMIQSAIKQSMKSYVDRPMLTEERFIKNEKEIVTQRDIFIQKEDKINKMSLMTRFMTIHWFNEFVVEKEQVKEIFLETFDGENGIVEKEFDKIFAYLPEGPVKYITLLSDENGKVMGFTLFKMLDFEESEKICVVNYAVLLPHLRSLGLPYLLCFDVPIAFWAVLEDLVNVSFVSMNKSRSFGLVETLLVTPKHFPEYSPESPNLMSRINKIVCEEDLDHEAEINLDGAFKFPSSFCVREIAVKESVKSKLNFNAYCHEQFIFKTFDKDTAVVVSMRGVPQRFYDHVKKQTETRVGIDFDKHIKEFTKRLMEQKSEFFSSKHKLRASPCFKFASNHTFWEKPLTVDSGPMESKETTAPLPAPTPISKL